MHWRASAFLICASALTPLSVAVLVTIAYVISYKRREISPTHVPPRDSGLRSFSPWSSCFVPADFLPTITLLCSGRHVSVRSTELGCSRVCNHILLFTKGLGRNKP
jgi:hypothetical protein